MGRAVGVGTGRLRHLIGSLMDQDSFTELSEDDSWRWAGLGMM